jgi:hypothetical protein
VAAVACVGVAATAVLALGGELSPPSRTDEPAAPPTSTSTPSSAGATPLEGTWTSVRLGAADVRAAARAAGAPEVAGLMLDQLPEVPFRVAVAVRGAVLTTTIVPVGDNASPQAPEVMDRESLTVTGTRMEVRPFGGVDARTVHTWVLDGDELSFSLVSTTEPSTDGVPGEAWHRLFYDAAAFTR